MVHKRGLVLILLILYTLGLCVTVDAASYSPGSFGNLTITANSDFTGGTYTITGNLVINSGVTLTVKGATTVQVTGNITVNGTIVTSNPGTSAYLVKLTSTNGNIVIGKAINISGTAGANGTAGAQTQNGTPGSTGGTVHLEIIAVTGDITVNGQITNNGGIGGTGGNGGGSQGNWITGKNGGIGGTGGTGGAAGRVKIVANAGTVTVNQPVQSIGGTGGTGGVGGPDQSVAGGPGAGGKGGNSGNGGSVIIVGQDVVLASAAALNVSAGAGGTGGAGGSAGSAGGTGAAGAAGAVGSAGSVTMVGGEVHKGSILLKDFSGLSVLPSTAQKTFLYDNAIPQTPSEVRLPYYQTADGIYCTNLSTVTFKVKPASDRGIDYEGVTYTSDLQYIYIASYEYGDIRGIPMVYEYENYDPGKVNAEGMYGVSLSIPSSPTMLHYGVSLIDKYNNKGKEYAQSTGGISVYYDAVAPTIQTCTSTVSGTNVTFNWTPGTDFSGVAAYDVYINRIVQKQKQTATSYLYNGTYNQKVDLGVCPWDGAGNVAVLPATPTKTAYTVAEGTVIDAVDITGTASTGYSAKISFASKGTNAAGYEIKYAQVDNLGQIIGAESVTKVNSSITPWGATQSCTIPGFSGDKTYRFAIRAFNQDPGSPLYTAWTYYGLLVTPAAPGTGYTLSGNEVWSGTRTLSGSLIIPKGVTLQIQPGAVVRSPYGSSIKVEGKLICDGTSGRITFTGVSGEWKGIYLTANSSGSVLKGILIENADRGLILDGQTLTISNSILRNNLIGLHMNNSSVTVDGCRFENNSHYGIKEESGCSSRITNNSFVGNGLAPYYSYLYTVLSVDRLNAKLGTGNKTQ